MALIRNITALLCLSVAAQGWIPLAVSPCDCCSGGDAPAGLTVQDAPPAEDAGECCSTGNTPGQERGDAPDAPKVPTTPDDCCDCPKVCCTSGKIFPAGIMIANRGVAHDFDARHQLSVGAGVDLPAHLSRLKRPPRAISFV